MSNNVSYKILTAKAATGQSTLIPVSDFNNITFVTVSAAGSTLTYKFQGAIEIPGLGSGAPVDFGAASTITNPWDYVDVIDLEDAASIDGDTGVALTTTAETRQFTVNVEGLDYVSIDITARSAGSLTAFVALYNYNR